MTKQSQELMGIATPPALVRNDELPHGIATLSSIARNDDFFTICISDKKALD